MKKFPTHVFEAPFCGPFSKMGGLPIGPKWTDLKNFQLFLTQNPNSNGVHLIKKFPTHVFRVTFCGPFWKIPGLPIGPQWTDLKIFQLFLTQNQN